MKLYFPNKQEIESKKKFIYKIFGKEYLFYTTGEPVNNLTTLAFGELKGTEVVVVAPEDLKNVSEFLIAFANNKAGGNPNYVLENDRLIDVIINGGSKSQIPSGPVDSLVVPAMQMEQKQAPASEQYVKPVISATSATITADSIEQQQKAAEAAKEAAFQASLNNNPATPQATVAQPAVASQPIQQTVAPVQQAPQSTIVAPVKPKKKKKGGIVALVILILLAAAGYIGYKLITSPKFIAVSSINTLTKSFNDTFNGTTTQNLSKFLYNNDKIKATEKLTVDIDPKMGLTTNTYTLSGTYVENVSSKTSSIDAQLTGGTTSILNGNVILNSDKLYFTIKNTLSKYYYQDQEYVSVFNKIDTNNLDVFRKLLIQSLESNIKDEDFTVTNEQLTLSASTNVKKYSLALTTDKVATIMTDYFNRIQKDGDAMNILMTTNSMTKDEVSQKLSDIVKDFQTNNDFKSTLNMYVKGLNEVVLVEYGDDTDTVQYYKYDSTQEIRSIDSKTKKTLFSVKLVLSNNVYNVTVSYDDKDYITGTIGKDGTFDLTYDMGNDSKVELKGSYALKEVTENADYMASFDITAILSSTYDGETTSYTFGIKNETEFTAGDTIDTSVIKDATSFDEMTEEDQKALYGIISLFSQVAGGSNSSTSSM
jgi:hypothetical protein